jgi:aspartyl-tRNA(Asn)/glutamyl-tRNA(Gln) amidotransferase subunit A
VDIASVTATELRAAFRERTVSPVEVVQFILARIDTRNPILNAFLAVAGDRALEEAARAEALLSSSATLPPLHGVPVGIKDLQRTEGIPTTFGSLAYVGHLPSKDCEAVARLRRAGAIVVGKTNTPFLGLLGETKNRLGRDCVNPWNLDRTPGGSSGGSAAALAAGLVPLATGTDSAGSITAPAAFTGVYGLKPTHGRIPTWPSPRDSLLLLDGGPMTRSVADAALMLTVMAGHDPRDPVSLRGDVTDFIAAVRSADEEASLSGLRIAYSPDCGRFRVSSEIREITRAAAQRFEDLGAIVEEVSPTLPDPFEIYMPLYVSDVRAAIGDRLEEFEPDFYPESERELREHALASAEQYVGVLNRLWHFRSAVAALFAEYDLLLTPATATTAFPIGKPPDQIDGQRVQPSWTTFMPFQVAWNLTGQPVASIPAGLSDDGLPVGLLIVGRLGREDNVLAASAAFERVSALPSRPPEGEAVALAVGSGDRPERS